MPTEYEIGLLVGLLIGEGHFGGDGRQPQLTLRMHVRHEALFRWLERTFPGGRLDGPYSHSGRDYYQWMARGSYLRDELMPLLADRLSPDLDDHSFARFAAMQDRYRSREGGGRRSGRSSPPAVPSASPAGGPVSPDPDPDNSTSTVFRQLRRQWPVESGQAAE